MCLELCVRGILYLIRLVGKRWLPRENTDGACRSRYAYAFLIFNYCTVSGAGLILTKVSQLQ